MYELKTKENNNSVKEFIEKVENSKKRQDAYTLLKIFTETTGLEAKMWGESMIGFGSYNYKYNSGHEGHAMLTGFSPRKAKISLYLALWDEESQKLLKELGKYTAGKGCVYINKVSDIHVDILRLLIKQTVVDIKKVFPD